MDQELLTKATEIYNKIKSFDLETRGGLNNQYILSPSEMMDDLDNNKRDYVRNMIVGIGGNEYIPKFQLRQRCLIRLSFATYQAYGIRFSDTDYVESLTQMDEGDARKWLRKCEGSI